MKKIQRVTVKALFQRENGEVMIAKSARDEYWELPGGKVEFGEQPEETLRREAEEELEIKDFEILRPLNLFSFEAKDSDGHWSFVVAVYLCRLYNEDLKLSDEHEETRWVKPENIREMHMRDGYYGSIEKLLKN
jgi:8-oxo-dGTP diphosphatase